MKKLITLCISFILSLGLMLGMAACGGGGEGLPTGVSLNVNSKTIAAGTTYQLRATVEPEDAVDKSVNWATSDENVATVSNEGLVTGIAEGEAVITVTTVSGSFSRDCTITVSAKYVEEIEITTEPNKMEYIEGEVFNPAGIVVTGIFSDGSEEDVTAQCTFTPDRALTRADDEITVTYRDTDIETALSIEVNVAVARTVSNDAELTAALADKSINKIIVADGATLSSISINRDIIVEGTLDIVSLSADAGVTLTVVGDVASSGNVLITGDGHIIVSGNIRGQNVEINGALTLDVKGIIDDSIFDGGEDEQAVQAIIYATSAIYSHNDIIIQRATVNAFNNIFCKGAATVNNGATLDVYGVSWCRNSMTYDHDHFGNGFQAIGGITLQGVETTVRVMNNTNRENGKAALQSDSYVTVDGATLYVGKAENVVSTYSWGIWATNGNMRITNGAQVTMIMHNEADDDPDSPVGAITTGIGSSRNVSNMVIEAGTADVVTKVVIQAGRPIRDKVTLVGWEFVEHIPWVTSE